MDNIPLSATNAAGGTRVIGVGCRYYTTPKRGVFIDESVGRINLYHPAQQDGATLSTQYEAT